MGDCRPPRPPLSEPRDPTPRGQRPRRHDPRPKGNGPARLAFWGSRPSTFACPATSAVELWAGAKWGRKSWVASMRRPPVFGQIWCYLDQTWPECGQVWLDIGGSCNNVGQICRVSAKMRDAHGPRGLMCARRHRSGSSHAQFAAPPTPQGQLRRPQRWLRRPRFDENRCDRHGALRGV